jgi:hypothetical protein
LSSNAAGFSFQNIFWSNSWSKRPFQAFTTPPKNGPGRPENPEKPGNDENRRSTNPAGRVGRAAGFVIPVSEFIRHSDFGFRH